MSIVENEFRVREIKRYVVTHFQSDDRGGRSCGQFGEFPNLRQANAVASALHESVEGSTVVLADDPVEPRLVLWACTDEQVSLLSRVMCSDDWKKAYS